LWTLIGFFPLGRPVTRFGQIALHIAVEQNDATAQVRSLQPAALYLQAPKRNLRRRERISDARKPVSTARMRTGNMADKRNLEDMNGRYSVETKCILSAGVHRLGRQAGRQEVDLLSPLNSQNFLLANRQFLPDMDGVLDDRPTIFAGL
jgi:hypothetical protein